MVTDIPTRPLLRYHGGKWKLAHWIMSYFPPHRIYVEPYGGAASVLLQKQRSYSEVYNDLDGEIVNLFRVLRDSTLAQELIKLIELTPYSREEFELAYLPSDDTLEQARRTVVRSAMGFASGAASGHITGFRANSNRPGGTPAHDWRSYPEMLTRIIERLRGVIIEHRHAIEVIKHHDSRDTLIYADPPYPFEARYADAATKSLYRHEATDDDHRELAQALHAADGLAVISGYPCSLYDDELYADWQRIERDAHAASALDRTEVLWISPRTWALLQDGAGLPLFAMGNRH